MKKNLRLRKANSVVPEGHHDNSPALQCRVNAAQPRKSRRDG